MPARLLPKSHPARLTVLLALKSRKDHVPAADWPFRETTADEFDTFFPIYWEKSKAVSNAKSNFSGTTINTSIRNSMSAKYVRAFLKSVISAVDLELIPRSHLILFGLELKKPTIPLVATASELDSWKWQIVRGETKRLETGDPDVYAIPLPTLAQCQAIWNNRDSLRMRQSNNNIAYADAQRELNLLTKKADLLILRLWNEIETFYDRGNPASLRRICRNWGVKYVSTKKDAPDAIDTSVYGYVSLAESHPIQHLAGATVKVVGTDIAAKSNKKGYYRLPPLAPNQYDLEFSHPLCSNLLQKGLQIVEDEVVQLNISLVEVS